MALGAGGRRGPGTWEPGARPPEVHGTGGPSAWRQGVRWGAEQFSKSEMLEGAERLNILNA